jgi:conjugative transfer region protein (TIGR03748 family)
VKLLGFAGFFIFRTFKFHCLFHGHAMPKSLFSCALACVFLLIVLSNEALATNTQVGRYLTVENKPILVQRELLSQMVQVRFPTDVKTIGEAMNYLLRFSGYALVAEPERNSDFKNTLLKPLPAVDRDFGPMSLKEALMTLAGPAFILKEDPLNRTINFQLNPRYASFDHKHLKRETIK